MSGDHSQGPGYSIECRAGRLIEARVHRLRGADEANAYAAALGAQVARIPPPQRAVLCADHRPVVIYTQSVADRLAALFADMNTRLERVAILVARSNATLLLQLDRLVREAAFSSRKVFHSPEGALEHLGSVLDASEIVRVRAFVADWQA